MNATIRPEIIEDLQSIWHVNRAAFEGESEANLVDALRDGDFVDVSLVAEVDGKVVGHILFSRVTIITKVGAMDAFSLAPMAVLPRHQRQGISDKASAASSSKQDFKPAEKRNIESQSSLVIPSSTQDSDSLLS